MSAIPRESLGQVFSEHFASDLRNCDRIASPGSQYVVQVLRGGYLGDDLIDGRGRAALDIGCGAGYDLVSLSRMGWSATGCDITKQIVEQARVNVAAFSAAAEVVVGTHTALPFADDSMALILSMNAMHYCDDESEMPLALAELRRVAVPGGRILLTMVHPENWILAEAKWESDRLARICASDFRRGHALYVFPSTADVVEMFSAFLDDVEVAVNHVSYFRKKLVNYVVTGFAPGQ